MSEGQRQEGIVKNASGAVTPREGDVGEVERRHWTMTVVEGHASGCPAVETGSKHGLTWTRIDNGRCICTPYAARTAEDR